METRLTLRRRYTTVELIVAEAEWTPRSRKPRSTRSPDDMVYIRVGYGEDGLRAKLKALGALCRPHSRQAHALTPLNPSDIVRASPLSHRQAPRSSHARRVTPLAELAIAFNPQVPPLTR